MKQDMAVFCWRSSTWKHQDTHQKKNKNDGGPGVYVFWCLAPLHTIEDVAHGRTTTPDKRTFCFERPGHPSTGSPKMMGVLIIGPLLAQPHPANALSTACG